MSSRKPKLLIECSCGSHILKLEKWDEDYFFTYYDICKDSLWSRLRQALELLVYGNYTSADMIIKKEDFNKLFNFLKEAKDAG